MYHQSFDLDSGSSVSGLVMGSLEAKKVVKDKQKVSSSNRPFEFLDDLNSISDWTLRDSSTRPGAYDAYMLPSLINGVLCDSRFKQRKDNEQSN